ncbi:MAG: hypothetical protein LH650_04235 [Chloroflexi bacterium]|nr:hypothetical protein [Chloroflexota bacterium]
MTETLDIPTLLARAMDAYDTLTSLGEDVEDEWTYVNDLSTAWRDRIEAVSSARAEEAASATAVAAVERLMDEVARIKDPHRAIDWLSTFPQVLLLAVGEQP